MLYFITCGGDVNFFIKSGKSKNPTINLIRFFFITFWGIYLEAELSPPKFKCIHIVTNATVSVK